jgi:hypothetical protein
MFESGDLCIPVNWSAKTDIRYLSARNVTTSRRAQYGDIFLFICWYAESNRFGDRRRLAQLMFSDGSIAMLYDGEFQKI